LWDLIRMFFFSKRNTVSGCPNQEIGRTFLFGGLIIGTFSYFGADSATKKITEHCSGADVGSRSLSQSPTVVLLHLHCSPFDSLPKGLHDCGWITGHSAQMGLVEMVAGLCATYQVQIGTTFYGVCNMFVRCM
jgi:hypothetical protein